MDVRVYVCVYEWGCLSMHACAPLFVLVCLFLRVSVRASVFVRACVRVSVFVRACARVCRDVLAFSTLCA